MLVRVGRKADGHAIRWRAETAGAALTYRTSWVGRLWAGLERIIEFACRCVSVQVWYELTRIRVEPPLVNRLFQVVDLDHCSAVAADANKPITLAGFDREGQHPAFDSGQPGGCGDGSAWFRGRNVLHVDVVSDGRMAGREIRLC